MELAWNGAEATDILREWGDAGIEAAQRSIRWDWVLIPSYVVVAIGLCLWGGRGLQSRLGRRWGVAVAALAATSGLLDAAENMMLIRILEASPPTNLAVRTTSVLAVVKFILLGVSVFFGTLTSLHRVAGAIEGWLSRSSAGGVTDPQRTQLLPEEHTRRPLGGAQFRRSTWRTLLRWMVGLPRHLPLATPDPPPAPRPDAPPVIGVCCSGGGIRSAAYNLGAIQTLQKEGVLKEARYLSAVSGGAYMAASLAAMVTKTDPQLLKEPPPYAPESPEFTYLLNHSSYLGPAGVWGKMWMVTRALLGVAVNIGFLAGILFLLGWPLGWWYRVLHTDLVTPDTLSLNVEPWMIVASTVPAAVGVLMVLGELLTNPTDRVRRLLRAWYVRFLVAGLIVFTLLVGIPYLVQLLRLLGLRSLPLAQFTLPTAGVAGLLVGAIQAFVAKRRLLLAMIAGAIIGPLLLLFLLVLFTRMSMFLSFDPDSGAFEPFHLFLWGAMAVIIGLFYVLADLTSWSPHPFYKRALWSAFGLSRRQPPLTDGAKGSGTVAQEISFDESVRLSQLPHGPQAPPLAEPFPVLIVCAAANVSDEGATPPGRSAATFTFTPERIGGPMVGSVGSKRFETELGPRHARHITLSAAMAISGAAISPSMGKLTRRSIRFLMALLNVRLGVWLPNPRWFPWWQDLETEKRSTLQTLVTKNTFLRGRPRPWFLVKEMMGANHLDSKFLYVSDGGHYENLGLVELLRRECTLIYCFDASGDEADTFFTIGEAIALARTELQVEITMRPEEMKADDEEEKLAPRDVVVGKVKYRNGTPGILIFTKASVTRKSPPDVRAFQRRDKRFPNHSTVDQFFNEEKFEAYRALGQDSAKRAVKLGKRATEGPGWLAAVRSSLGL